ncbi:MAG: hypothetical protein EOO53_21845 [Gammaproteobacteria bacterium]|nr:MAG: hypothetical protein EOO53_21845 [Gammaproteobacteria bacterium]
MSALAEVLWTQKDKRNWNDFEKRLQTQFKRYDLWKANYSKASFELKASILPAPNNQGLVWKIESKNKGDSLMFHNFPKDAACIDFTDGKKKSKLEKIGYYAAPYSKLLKCSGSYGYKLVKRAMEFPLLMQDFFFNKATGKKVSMTATPNEKYPGQGGAFSLVNGVYSRKGLSNPDWLGFIGADLEATIDLGKSSPIDSVRMHTINQNGSWVYLPQYVEIFTSSDGKTFTSAGIASEFVSDTLTMGWITVPMNKKPARFIKLVAKNYGLIPDGQPGAGTKAWLFADEIQVY